MEINGRFLDELEIKRIERELSNFNPVPKIGDGVIFDSGTKMYRFITPGDNAELGQWWFDGTFKKRIERFQKMKSVQKKRHCSIMASNKREVE